MQLLLLLLLLLHRTASFEARATAANASRQHASGRRHDCAAQHIDDWIKGQRRRRTRRRRRGQDRLGRGGRVLFVRH